MDRTSVGLAYERLNSVRSIHEVEPFLIDEGVGEEQLVEAAFKRALQNLSVGALLQRAAQGGRLERGEQELVNEVVEFLRGEADRLHLELVDQIGRGRGEGRTRKAGRATGKATRVIVGVIIVTAVTTIVTLAVTAYFAGWLPGAGDDERGKPPPTETMPG